MKRLYLPVIGGFLLAALSVSAQSVSDPAAVIRRVADHVLGKASFRFTNSKTSETYTSTAGLPLSADLKAESPYARWEYPNGVLAIGLMQTGAVLKEKKYADYCLHNYGFIFDNLDYFEKLYRQNIKAEWAPFFSMNSLDACGAMAAGLSDVNELAKKKVYQDYLERAADFISTRQLRFPDGTLCRAIPRYRTLWADDLYMSVPFLARMGKRTGNKKYIDDAIRQVEAFNKYLYDPSTGLYFHCYYDSVDHNGVARWGRCNGWIAMAQAELLNNLPADHPKRKELIGLLLRQIIGFSRYQDSSGLWRQVLDRPDAYLETSVTAMFVYAVARAVNEGWIPRSYLSIAKDGWEGLVSKITPDGEVEDVCIGTSIGDNIRFYLSRPKRLNDTHALGAVLLAGTEMIKALEGNGMTGNAGAAVSKAKIFTGVANGTSDLSLNGEWQTGLNRQYDQVTRVPGVVADPAVITDAVRWYKKEIDLPPGDWKNAVLELKGARFLPKVYIDGSLVSALAGGMGPTFHLLSDKAVRPGNRIRLEIALAPLNKVPLTDASYIPPADQWRSDVSSGLWDGVVLHFYKDHRLQNVLPFIDIDHESVLLHIHATGAFAETGLQYKVEVQDQDGRTLIERRQPIGSFPDTISFSYKDILSPWSPAKPNLYRLDLTLLTAAGETEDQVNLSFGIRKFVVSDKQFYLNDQPCKVSGGTVVWHRWVRTKEGARLGYDTAWFHTNVIRRLKEHGANYLRFHLGKPPEALLDLCDRYGLLVQYEWNFFHGMPASKESLLEQFRPWLDAAARHPCVVFIHPYNETEGKQLDTMWQALNTLLPDYPAWALEGRDIIHVHKYWWSLFENLGLYYDDYRQFPQAIMVDEFGGNYTDGKGDPGAYPTVKESNLRFLGREQTKEERLEHQAASNSKVAEYWRRTGAAGFAPFCILSSDEDGNSWFMGNPEQGSPKPVWDALTAAWSPRSVSLELWDRNFSPGQELLLPVYVFNDLPEAGALHVKVTVRDGQGREYTGRSFKSDMRPFSREIKNILVSLPEMEGDYVISAELLDPPADIRYPVISKWPVHVFAVRVPAGLTKIKVAVPDEERELKDFLHQSHIRVTGIQDKDAGVIITSAASWKRIAAGDGELGPLFQQAIMAGKSIVLLDIGDRRLGQGYPSRPGDLGPLQGVATVKDPQTSSYKLFGGITVSFREMAEPESCLQPDKDDHSLWKDLHSDFTWLWNGLRGGLIVPAADMEFSGLSPASFLTQWETRGADEALIKGDHYYAYELQGFYAYSKDGDDEDVKKKLKEKVGFLVQDAPALAIAINPATPVRVKDLAVEYAGSKGSIAQRLVPLANAGKNLTRTPVLMIGFGKGKGRLIASQLLTAGRLAQDPGRKGLYDIRYDGAAAQMVLNMMNLALQDPSPVGLNL